MLGDIDMKIVILNGPNLNLLGKREPAIYGTRSMEQVLLDIQRAYPNVYFQHHQSNHEGDLIDWLQYYGGERENVLEEEEYADVKGIILNAGGYTHTSVALRDAVVCSQVPVVEVHISNIAEREEFRRVSLLTDVCQHTIMGQGTDGYIHAVAWILRQINKANA